MAPAGPPGEWQSWDPTRKRPSWAPGHEKLGFMGHGSRPPEWQTKGKGREGGKDEERKRKEEKEEKEKGFTNNAEMTSAQGKARTRAAPLHKGPEVHPGGAY